MFKSLPPLHAHTFKFLLARLSSSDLACPLIFSVSWWCKLWLPKIPELLPLSSRRVEAHSWSLLWGSLCSSAPTNNTVFSQTLYREAVSVSQFLLPGFLEQSFFWKLDQIWKKTKFSLLTSVCSCRITCLSLAAMQKGVSPQWHAVIFQKHQNKALLTSAHNFTGKSLHHKQQKRKVRVLGA